METVGVVGLGLMGSGFAANLLSRGHGVLVYNRTESKAEALSSRGAAFRRAPADLAREADVVLTSLTDGKAVEEVAFGPGGFVKAMRRGALWLDASTIDPRTSVRHAQQAKEFGVERLDTPVVGGPAAASQGKVVLLVGGDEGVYRKRTRLLDELGQKVVYLGPDGSGHKMKLAVNLYLGLTAMSFSEAVVLAQKMGFRASDFVNAFNSTAHRNPFSETKGPKIAAGDYTPTFTLDNMLKDLRLAGDEAKARGTTLPLFAKGLEFASAAAAREGSRDYSALAKELQRLNDTAQEERD
ncbi:MAG: NAD(P)-dependent oxidoreductase [Nitrososphaerota archaeon]|nr:NAD(P)-dependent oxidoreductase [Nitrososphaerota archaeon]